MSENNEIDEGALPQGSIISGRYRLERVLGIGGMGHVYLAQDQLLVGRDVAIKVLRKDYARTKAQVERFLREVELMHRITHENVVRTYDAGFEQELLYFTMEFLCGTPLDVLIEKQSLGLKRALGIVIQICWGLEAIHSHDVVHRDLKPSNIIVLEDGTAKITDFGVARPKESSLTQHNEVIGSLDYIAPEAWLGKEITPAVDLYALGVILYELVTGKLPFEVDSAAQAMFHHVKSIPPPPKILRPELPAWINQLILKLLAKTPSDRPKNPQEIIKVIEAHIGTINAELAESVSSTAETRVLTERDAGKTSAALRQRIARQTTQTAMVTRQRYSGDHHSKRLKFAASLPLLMMGVAFLGIVLYLIVALIMFLKELLII